MVDQADGTKMAILLRVYSDDMHHTCVTSHILQPYVYRYYNLQWMVYIYSIQAAYS